MVASNELNQRPTTTMQHHYRRIDKVNCVLAHSGSQKDKKGKRLPQIDQPGRFGLFPSIALAELQQARVTPYPLTRSFGRVGLSL